MVNAGGRSLQNVLESAAVFAEIVQVPGGSCRSRHIDLAPKPSGKVRDGL